MKILTISKDKTRTPLTILRTLKKNLEKIAKKENKTLNELMITALTEYVNKVNKNT